MIIFINEDDDYLAWLAAHPRGYVVNAQRRPKARYLILHKSSCADINSARRGHWTSGPYIKICARSAQELVDWARTDVGGQLQACQRCRPRYEHLPDADANGRDAAHPHLTRVGEHLLSHILELAVISLDGLGDYAADPPQLKKLANYFGKTVPQLLPILRRLQEDGFVSLGTGEALEARVSPRTIVYPTPAALRTVPAFTELDERVLVEAIASLHEPRQQVSTGRRG